MVLLHHEIIANYGDIVPNKKITSTLVEYGNPNAKYTAIAKTVGAPAAIAAKLLLKGELKLTGCHIPTHNEIYPIVLEELKSLGIEFSEKVETIEE